MTSSPKYAPVLDVRLGQFGKVHLPERGGSKYIGSLSDYTRSQLAVIAKTARWLLCHYNMMIISDDASYIAARAGVHDYCCRTSHSLSKQLSLALAIRDIR